MAMLKSDLEQHLPLVASGKVRELYALNEDTLLFVATDRISGRDRPPLVRFGPPVGCWANRNQLLTLSSQTALTEKGLS